MLLLYFVENTNDLQGMTSAEAGRKRAYSADINFVGESSGKAEDGNGLTFPQNHPKFE